MIKVFTVFGTRPDAVKMAPLVKELKSRKEISCRVCITAQHRQMLDIILDCFSIVPDYDLNIMQPNQTLSYITASVMNKIGDVLKIEKPDIVLVHGDTSTAFAAALAAYYMQIPVGHVEAGLRTYNKYSPFPEEMNRQLVDVIADMYFAPTEETRQNLLNENKDDKDIYVTGNTEIDALAYTVKKGYSHPILDWCKGSRLLLMTAHRRENLGEPMRRFFKAIRRIVTEHPDVKVVYPVHMNPLVKEAADEILSGMDRIKLIEPLNVIDFHNFMAASYFILTDSGGVQEGGPGLGKPVIVLRDTTERPEGVKAGTLKLAGTEEEAVYGYIKELLTDEKLYRKMSQAINPYGDGKASQRIADALMGRCFIR
jgi:UDP-N-acetylglucosamine 2-epimerase (non-hydrolysing)